MMNYTPLRYPGGKGKTYHYIKELVTLNKCKTYIEPFAGGAGVAIALLLNNDVQKIMINDYDKAIYAFWYSVINFTSELIELIMQTDITVKEWYKQREIYLNKENIDDLLSLGFATLFINRTNRSGILKAGVIGGKKQNGKYKIHSRFNKLDICNRILLIGKYKNKIKLYNLDAENFIKCSISKTKNSFTFFDPPYYKKGESLYTNFYTHQNHENLAQIINKHMKNKKWILTYDDSKEILNMYKDYSHHKYYLNYSITKPYKGIELIFYSPNIKKGTLEKHLQRAYSKI